jgi:hypothetical protein
LSSSDSSSVGALFANRRYPFYLLSRLALIISTQMLSVAVGWQVWEITGKARKPAAVYEVCSVIAFVAVLAVIAIGHRPTDRAAKPSGRATLATLFAGIRYVWSNGPILGAISLDLFAVLLGGAVALLPIYASDYLHIGAWGLGILRSAPAVGAASTALALAWFPLKRHAGIVMFICVFAIGICTIIFGLSRQFALSLVALVILGAVDMVSVVIRSTLIQLKTPDDMRGRVSAVNMVFIGASNDLGEFESGITAAWLGPELAVLVGGIGTCVVVLVWMGLFPELRKVDQLSAD